MNLNHLAIALIELDPENLSELDGFKKNLVLSKGQAKGRLKDVLGQACAEVEAWSGQDPESRQAGIVRLGELLEQAMEFSGGNPSGAKPEEPRAVPPEKIESQKITLSKNFDSDLLNEFIVENMELANMAESAMLDWEKDPDNHELLNTIFRGFHTIKGTSAFLNLDCIKDLAHQVESMLARVRDGQDNFTIGHADLGLKSLDLIKIILERMKSSGPGRQIELPLGHEELLEALRNSISSTRDPKVNDRSDKPISERRSKERRIRKDGETSADQPLPGQVVESTVRVKIDRLDKLLDTVGELVIAQTMVGQDELIVNRKHHELNKKISQAGKIVRELHDLSLILRMVPLKGTFQKMARLARDLSQKNGKKVNFITEGDETEIDRNMVDMVADPLVHLIRNAVDHGIETPEERHKIGKSSESRIYLTAGHSENSILLTVWDDGRGLSRQKIVDKAIARGMIDSAERMTDQEVWEMIFHPGFSTTEQVTEVSGRGVGLDVVRKAVEALRGRIEVQSSEGKGCAFIMKMPLTMAITDGMVVKVGSQRYILPTANIQKAIRPAESDIHTVNQRAEMLSFRDELLPVFRLHLLFNIPDAKTQLTSGLLVVISEGPHRCALFVDDLLTQTQVVTKSLGKGINDVSVVAGGAIMGDGTVGLILDAAGIISMARQRLNITT
jgi:two-component system chemotaxis sensor kinase CheA